MSQLPPANQTPHSADPAAPVVEPGFEVTFNAFWDKNRSQIYVIFAVVLVAIIAREGWQYYAASHEADVQAEYAKLTDQPAKLATFADANSGHPLAGLAYLKAADDKYSAGDFAGAATAYTKAAGSLTNEALLGRAKLGAAISQLNGADQAAGEAALKAISADATLMNAVRAEAAYHLASLAAAAGKTDEVKKLVDQVSRIDAAGPWSQRATVLLARPPAGPAAPATDASGITFKPTGK